MIYSILASIMLITAITLFFDLTPERVTEDILRIISPKDSMQESAKALRGNKRKHKLYHSLIKFHTALETTGRSKTFTAVCFASIFLFGAGIIFSMLIDNIYEDILKQSLNSLNGDFSTLKMQAQELMVRNSKNQMQMPLVA